MSMFNSEQESYMQYLSSVPPEKKCWCGWYTLDEPGGCPNRCEVGKTAADKLAARCPECHNEPLDFGRGDIYHRAGCSKRTD